MADEGRHRRPVDARDHPTDPCNRRVGEVAPPLARISSCRPARRAAAICGNEIVRSQLFDLPLQSLHPRRLLHIEQPPAPTCLHSPRAGLRPSNFWTFKTRAGHPFKRPGQSSHVSERVEEEDQPRCCGRLQLAR
jgi:hypothetical protein